MLRSPRQEEVCPGWADPPEKLLSFGCSVGLEMEDDRADRAEL